MHYTSDCSVFQLIFYYSFFRSPLKIAVASWTSLLNIIFITIIISEELAIFALLYATLKRNILKGFLSGSNFAIRTALTRAVQQTFLQTAFPEQLLRKGKCIFLYVRRVSLAKLS